MPFSNLDYLGPSMVFKPATLTQLSRQGISFHNYIQFCLPSASLLLITIFFSFSSLSYHTTGVQLVKTNGCPSLFLLEGCLFFPVLPSTALNCRVVYIHLLVLCPLCVQTLKLILYNFQLTSSPSQQSLECA